MGTLSTGLGEKRKNRVQFQRASGSCEQLAQRKGVVPKESGDRGALASPVGSSGTGRPWGGRQPEGRPGVESGCPGRGKVTLVLGSGGRATVRTVDGELAEKVRWE